MEGIHLIGIDAEFPATCQQCGVRKLIGCYLADANFISDDRKHPKCPLKELEFVGEDTHVEATVAEHVCLMCLHRFVGVRPDGYMLKDMQCPNCKLTGGVIETGEWITGDDG